ncbi:MAG: ABC transporter ATP-binding protein [Blastocatellia bacterium]
MSELAIETVRLTKSFGRTVAVAGLDLAVPKGSTFGFLGRNGAGKSTTIRMLLGLVRPTSGVGRVFGRDIRFRSDPITRSVGAIVETPAFYDYLSASENLLVLSLSYGLTLTSPQTARLLDAVGLAGVANRRVRTFSTGMKQRLGLAAALINTPALLFLDEPTNGLDPSGMVDMRDTIAQLGRQGTTVFISSHDLSEVEQVCTDVAIIEGGRVRLQGAVRDILLPRTTLSVLARPVAAASSLLRTMCGAVDEADVDGWLHVQASAEQAPEIVRALVEARIDVCQVTSRKASLEDVFMEVTKLQ